MTRHFFLRGEGGFDILTVSYQFSGGRGDVRRDKLRTDRRKEGTALEGERGDLGPLLLEQLREQMNNLSASIQLLSPVVREKGGEKYDPYLAILNQSLYRILRMLGNVEFLELEEWDRPDRRKGSLDLAGLCRELAAQVGPLAELVKVSFSYEEEKGSLLTLGDSRLLRRMLLELISNALKAAGPGGRAGLRLAVHRDRAVLTVWDDGPGLPPPDQAPAGPLERPAGLGLGLRVARRAAEAHGGAIVFEQREDRGCRAVVSLPIRSPGREELRTPTMGWDGTGGFSDLLVGLASVLPHQAFLPDELE